MQMLFDMQVSDLIAEDSTPSLGAENLSGPARQEALSAFYDCKALMMTHYESLHGESAQRDVSYLLALQRLLTNELGEPPQELRKTSELI